MEEPKPDKEGNISIRLNADDSALIVRADGTVEVVSREMVETEDGYVGDVEDLNKTFSLVLALAASLEDENLYSMIYNNLNTASQLKDLFLKGEIYTGQFHLHIDGTAMTGAIHTKDSKILGLK